MQAILWDGQKQINGELILEKSRIKFRLADFCDTDLVFDLAYGEIARVAYHKLYQLQLSGLEIISKNNRRNVFVVAKPSELKSALQVRCGLYT